jgi:PEP-CTERM/exosortase A-associated glycosyltransferase
MKILHILDHSLPLHSGYTFRSHNIFQAQRNRGWHPVIVTSPKHEESWKGVWEPQEQINGFRYYRTGPISNNCIPFKVELQLMRALGRRIQEVAHQEKPDIIHAHSPVLNVIPALWAGRKLRIPVVYEIRAFWEDAAVDHGTYAEGSWKYNLTKSIETWVCKRADQVAVLCNGLKNDLAKRGISSQKITPVFNGINPDDFKPCPPDEGLKKEWNLSGKKVIGFIGSFYRYEGLDLLINAFSRLASHHPSLPASSPPSIVLLLVGGGEMENELKAQIKRLRLEGKVIMPGRIPHDRIPGVYALIDILAYPRYSMRLTELVTPLKPLEAMAMGKALVASNVGGHKELIQHNKTSLLFSAGNETALAEALKRILDDDSLRKNLEFKGSAWVREHHTWKKTTSVYEDIYRKAFRCHPTTINSFNRLEKNRTILTNK